MSEMGDDFREYKEYLRSKRQQKRTLNTGKLLDILTFMEYTYDKFWYQWKTEYHLRLWYGAKAVDVFPTSGKYHDIQLNKRGYTLFDIYSLKELLDIKD